MGTGFGSVQDLAAGTASLAIIVKAQLAAHASHDVRSITQRQPQRGALGPFS